MKMFKKLFKWPASLRRSWHSYTIIQFRNGSWGVERKSPLGTSFLSIAGNWYNDVERIIKFCQFRDRGRADELRRLFVGRDRVEEDASAVEVTAEFPVDKN